MILEKEAGDGGMPMARTARAAFTKSSPVPVWLQYFEKCSKLSVLSCAARQGVGFALILQASAPAWPEPVTA